jgi:ribosomal-protein-serine acetyltransferase
MVEDSLEFLTTIVEEEQVKCTGIHLGIFDVSMAPHEPENLLGAVAIRNINLSNHSGEVGCWLSQESQGKGLATVACLKIIDYGKSVLGIERFELHTAVDNHRTQALAERLGFKRLPGVIKSAEVIDSKPVDHVVFIILNDQ